MEATAQKQLGTCGFISTVQPDTDWMEELLHALLRVSNGYGMETHEPLLGKLDDEKVQAIQWAQNQSKQKAATSGGRESKLICALESGVLLDGWMMGAG